MSKNKNIYHRVKETCAIMLTQVIYETDYSSVLCHSTMSGLLTKLEALCLAFAFKIEFL